METETPEEHAPEALDVVGMETRLTKADGVIDRGAEDINVRNTVIEGTAISGERTIVETGSITGTRARTNNKGINDGLTDMTAPEDFNLTKARRKR